MNRKASKHVNDQPKKICWTPFPVMYNLSTPLGQHQQNSKNDVFLYVT